jgi:hypothetical protein
MLITTKIMLIARINSMTFASPLKSSSCCIFLKIKLFEKRNYRGYVRVKVVLLQVVACGVDLDMCGVLLRLQALEPDKNRIFATVF